METVIMNSPIAKGAISAQSPLIFMHLPKTGGMSMFTAFTALWRTAIADLYDVSSRNGDIAARVVKDSEKILYCGHFSFGLHEWLDRPSYYISVLREPVSRVVSLYHYCQPMLTRYRELVSKKDGDMAWLRAQPNLSDYYFDFEPWLTGEPSVDSFFASPSAELDNGMVRRFSGYGLNPAPCPDTALELAKNNIENYFSVVGLLERYPETLELMAKTFGLPALNENHVNKNRPEAKDASLPEHIMQKIRDMNRLDTALYEWVSTRFDEKLMAPRAIAVPGGGRSGPAGMPLWLGVGQSPVRDASMKQGGVPKIAKKPAEPVLCQRLAGMKVKSGVIHAEIDTVIREAGAQPKPGARLNLAIRPELAKLLIETLQKSVDICEKGVRVS